MAVKIDNLISIQICDTIAVRQQVVNVLVWQLANVRVYGLSLESVMAYELNISLWYLGTTGVCKVWISKYQYRMQLNSNWTMVFKNMLTIR